MAAQRHPRHPAAASARDHAQTLDARQRGPRIRSARERAGFSQRDLASAAGVSASAVAQWEAGSSRPGLTSLASIAGALQVTADWLLTGAEAAVHRDATADLRLLQEARELGVDLAGVIAEARQRKWREENRGALADANAFVARHGLWSDGKRQF